MSIPAAPPSGQWAESSRPRRPKKNAGPCFPLGGPAFGLVVRRHAASFRVALPHVLLLLDVRRGASRASTRCCRTEPASVEGRGFGVGTFARLARPAAGFAGRESPCFRCVRPSDADARCAHGVGVERGASVTERPFPHRAGNAASRVPRMVRRFAPAPTGRNPLLARAFAFSPPDGAWQQGAHVVRFALPAWQRLTPFRHAREQTLQDVPEQASGPGPVFARRQPCPCGSNVACAPHFA